MAAYYCQGLCYQEWSLTAGHSSKAIKGKVGGKESLLYFGSQQLEVEGRLMSKGQLLPLTINRQEFLKGSFRGV